MILKLVNELPCAKVFVTSRKEADITNKFSQLNEPTIEIEAKNSADDIEIYVRGQVGSLISEGDLQLQDDSLQEKIIQEHALNDHQENKRMIGDGISFIIYNPIYIYVLNRLLERPIDSMGRARLFDKIWPGPSARQKIE